MYPTTWVGIFCVRVAKETNTVPNHYKRIQVLKQGRYYFIFLNTKIKQAYKATEELSIAKSMLSQHNYNVWNTKIFYSVVFVYLDITSEARPEGSRLQES